MNWKEYEEITKVIYEALENENGIEILGYGNNCKIIGNSGVEHQIDVLTLHTDVSGDSFKTAIECKYWEEKINKDIVMKLLQILNDSDIKKGVIVSKNGYTPDATKYAEFYNIGLIHLYELDIDRYINPYTKPPSQNVKCVTTGLEIEKIIVEPFDNMPYTQGEVSISDVQITANGQTFRLESLIQQAKEDYYKKTQKGNVLRNIGIETAGAKYDFKVARLQNFKTNEDRLIKSITIAMKSTTTDIKFYQIIDEVWLRLNKIFEKQNFTITKMGKIYKNEY